MSKLFTKAQIAKLYKVQPRTVSNWLSRARAEMGEGFPGNYEKNALVFTDDQVDVLLKYSNGADAKIATPEVTVMEPGVPDTHETSTALEVSSHTARHIQPILNIHIHAAPVGRIVADTTAIEAQTHRLNSITTGQVHSLVEALSARFQAGVEGLVAQQDQVLAAAMAQSVSAGSEAVQS